MKDHTKNGKIYFTDQLNKLSLPLQVKVSKREMWALGYLTIVGNYFGQMLLSISQHVVKPGFTVHSYSWTIHDSVQLLLGFQHALVTVMTAT